TIRQRCEDVRKLLTTNAGRATAETGANALLSELLERIWSPGPSWFIDSPALADELLAACVESLTPKTSANDARDRFCYKALKAGRSLAWVRGQVAKRKRWEELATPQGVSQAAKRYADRNGLDWPV